MREDFLITAKDMAEGLTRLGQEDALSLDFLAERSRLELLDASEGLTYRVARPVIGEGLKCVAQDFELCMDIAANSPFHRLADALGELTNEALAMLRPSPLATIDFNDLIVQRYTPGSRGITPHRDHVRYQGMVALVILVGEARFCITDDRAGTGAREISSPPGSLLLMRAPGYDGSKQRPFHTLRQIRTFRVSVGLRYDARADQVAA